MKTIIISDIHSKSDSIIPYGLNLAKTLESEVDILHTIDPRLHQGEYSSFSDSKSITPGSTMSHDEIVQREKNKADIALDKLLSSEASRLNYPLKVNVVVEENNIFDAVKTILQQEPSALFIMSSEPDGDIFQWESEIDSILEKTGAMALLVPPRQTFRMINKVIFPFDFNLEDFGTYAKIHSFMRHFNPVINAVGFEKNGQKPEVEKSKKWIEMAKSAFVPSAVKTHLLKGEDFGDALENYIEYNQPDLLIFLQQKQKKLISIFKKNESMSFLHHINVPVLIHLHN